MPELIRSRRIFSGLTSGVGQTLSLASTIIHQLLCPSLSPAKFTSYSTKTAVLRVSSSGSVARLVFRERYIFPLAFRFFFFQPYSFLMVAFFFTWLSPFFPTLRNSRYRSQKSRILFGSLHLATTSGMSTQGRRDSSITWEPVITTELSLDSLSLSFLPLDGEASRYYGSPK